MYTLQILSQQEYEIIVHAILTGFVTVDTDHS